VDGDVSNDSEDGLTAVKAQDFHFMLSVILDLFIDPLITKGMLWDLVYKNKVYPKIHYHFLSPWLRVILKKLTLCVVNTSQGRQILGSYAVSAMFLPWKLVTTEQIIHPKPRKLSKS
jgi:hypothetical protein